MLRLFKLTIGLLAALAAVMPLSTIAQDDPNDIPLGDVARNLRKKTLPSEDVIDNDNLSRAMEEAESRHVASSTVKYAMSGEGKGFQVSAPDVTCSLSFTANTKALLSSQYAQMDLPAGDIGKLRGPATIEGDALTVSIFNGTDWHVSEVDVALTVVRKKEVADADVLGIPQLSGVSGGLGDSDARPEKKSDLTLIYRMRSAAPPFATTVFSTPLNVEVAGSDEWHWAIVQAKGYPPAVDAENRNQTAEAVQPASTPPPPTSLGVVPASLVPHDSSASTLLSQDPH